MLLNGYDTFIPNNSHESCNESSNGHNKTSATLPSTTWTTVCICALLATFSLITIIGNILVTSAVCIEKYLRTATNYFIVSLSLADLLIGFLVMPFSILMEAESGRWRYGKRWCDLWHSFDVLASTASILNLSIISLDRYWAITDPIAYPHKMSSKRALILVGLVWFCSAGISFPAIFWWDYVTPATESDLNCIFTEDSIYLICSSLISFYLPMCIIFYAYWSIYNAAMKQKKIIMSGTMTMDAKKIGGSRGEMSEERGKVTIRVHRGGYKQMGYSIDKEFKRIDDYSSTSSNTSLGLEMVIHPMARNSTNSSSPYFATHLKRPSHLRPSCLISKKWAHFTLRQRISRAAKEQKAAKTLGFVVGVFCFCCSPFFVTNLMYGICYKTCVPKAEVLFPIFTWLAYVNSGMNPFIYAYSLKDFRRAFLKIIFCRTRNNKCKCFRT